LPIVVNLAQTSVLIIVAGRIIPLGPAGIAVGKDVAAGPKCQGENSDTSSGR
jgi:hypothetical protein